MSASPSDVPTGWFTRHRRPLMLVASASTGVVVAALVVPTLSDAGSAPPPANRAKVRAELLAHREAALWSGAARAALYGTGAHRPGEQDPGSAGEPQPDAETARLTAARQARGGSSRLASAGLANVLVNNPAEDTHQTDQTTQSETSIAVSGKHVAVGFNDSQQNLLAFTGGADLSGVAYSTDGGAHFTDGGTIPNPLNFTNAGDPWLTSDRSGAMYYSTLTFGGNVGNLEIAVSKSTNGGKSWSKPKFVSPNDDNTFYFGDKDAMTAGRSPTDANKDNLYVSWDDQVCQPTEEDFVCFSGLPLARSTNGGRTWTMSYVDKLASDPESCSFAQYIGAQPFVSATNGNLFVAAEKFSVNDPDCEGTAPVTASEVIFRSTDGGKTFNHGVTIDDITPATPDGALVVGPGQFIRTVEFPTVAKYKGKLYVGWNDGRTGHSHIEMAKSADGGNTWTVHQVTSGANDELQPALTGDASGVHLAYYRRNANNTLDTVVGDSTDGVHFDAHAVTSRSFPGVETVPQFDPIIAFGYMGDYIAQVSVGGTQYFAWGDNRKKVVDFMYPQGRHDPDVFFAKR